MNKTYKYKSILAVIFTALLSQSSSATDLSPNFNENLLKQGDQSRTSSRAVTPRKEGTGALFNVEHGETITGSLAGLSSQNDISSSSSPTFLENIAFARIPNSRVTSPEQGKTVRTEESEESSTLSKPNSPSNLNNSKVTLKIPGIMPWLSTLPTTASLGQGETAIGHEDEYSPSVTSLATVKDSPSGNSTSLWVEMPESPNGSSTGLWPEMSGKPSGSSRDSLIELDSPNSLATADGPSSPSINNRGQNLKSSTSQSDIYSNSKVASPKSIRAAVPKVAKTEESKKSCSLEAAKCPNWKANREAVIAAIKATWLKQGEVRGHEGQELKEPSSLARSNSLSDLSGGEDSPSGSTSFWLKTPQNSRGNRGGDLLVELLSPSSLSSRDSETTLKLPDNEDGSRTGDNENQRELNISPRSNNQNEIDSNSNVESLLNTQNTGVFSVFNIEQKPISTNNLSSLELLIGTADLGQGEIVTGHQGGQGSKPPSRSGSISSMSSEGSTNSQDNILENPSSPANVKSPGSPSSLVTVKLPDRLDSPNSPTKDSWSGQENSKTKGNESQQAAKRAGAAARAEAERAEEAKKDAKNKASSYALSHSHATVHQTAALKSITSHLDSLNTYSLSIPAVLTPAGDVAQDSMLMLPTSNIKAQGGFNPWISGYQARSNQGKIDNNPSYKTNSTGFSIGSDFAYGENTIWGAYYSNSHSKVKYRKEKDGDTSNTSFHTFGLYSQHNFNSNLFMQSAISYTRGFTKNEFKNPAYENYKLSSVGFSGFITLNNAFEVSKNTLIIPRIGLRYISNKDKDVKVGNDKIKGTRNQHLTALLGSKVVFRKQLANGTLIMPSLYAGIEQDVWNKSTGSKAEVQAEGEKFKNQGSTKSKHLGYNLGAEVLAKKNNMTIGITYQCDIAQKYLAHQTVLLLKLAL